jgi:hypothetical protein
VLGDGIEEFGGNSYDNAFYGCDISEIILLDTLLNISIKLKELLMAQMYMALLTKLTLLLV